MCLRSSGSLARTKGARICAQPAPGPGSAAGQQGATKAGARGRGLRLVRAGAGFKALPCPALGQRGRQVLPKCEGLSLAAFFRPLFALWLKPLAANTYRVL